MATKFVRVKERILSVFFIIQCFFFFFSVNTNYTFVYNLLNFPAGVVTVSTVTAEDEEEFEHYPDKFDKVLKEVSETYQWGKTVEIYGAGSTVRLVFHAGIISQETRMWSLNYRWIYYRMNFWGGFSHLHLSVLDQPGLLVEVSALRFSKSEVISELL